MTSEDLPSGGSQIIAYVEEAFVFGSLVFTLTNKFIYPVAAALHEE